MLVAALVSSGARGPDVPKTREFSATVRVRNSVQLLNGRAKQVRSMILAMPELHDAVGLDRVIPARRRAIQTDTTDRDLIHLAGRIPEVGLEHRPVGVMQPAEDDTQAIVGEFRWTQGLPADGLQGTLMALGPVM